MTWIENTQVHEVTIIHISDIHAGVEEKAGRTIITKPIGPGIASVLKAAFPLGVKKGVPKILLITGDIVQADKDVSEMRKRYGIAKQEILEAMRVLGFKKSDRRDVIILPGNHDVVRPKSGDVNPEGLVLFQEFLREFYEPDIPPLAFEVKPKGDGLCEYRRRPWCIERYGILIWPLFSCTLDTKTNTDGVVDEDQITDGALFLKKTVEASSRRPLVMAVTHHNFMPAFQKTSESSPAAHRSGRRNEGYPRGGMEGLFELFKDGVNIVLHGHRHQEFAVNFGDWNNDASAVEQSPFVTGAPSIGYFELGRESTHDYAGFNSITVIHTDASSRLEISKYQVENEKNKFFIRLLKPRNVNLRRLGRLREFLEFKDGYDSFVQDSLCSSTQHDSRRVNILHYHDDTRWENAYKHFWGFDALNWDQISRNLNDIWLKPGDIALLDGNEITEKLAKILRLNGVDDLICEALTAAPNANVPAHAFARHVHNLASESDAGARILAYISEAIICATRERCTITKHVHIRPVKQLDCKLRTFSEEKFRWLCESLLLVRSVKNFNFTWLPYSIRDYQGKSLVGIAENREGSAAEIYYVGFDPQPRSYSVLRLPAETNRRSTAEGPILSDLKAVMRKVVNPLAALLVSEFPIMVEGKLNLSLLNIMAKATGMEHIWQSEYKDKIEAAFKGRVPRGSLSVASAIRKLESLYSWVAKNRGEGLHLPWSASERSTILDNLE